MCSRTSSNPHTIMPESASPAAASRPDYPVHPVHRCSIYSPSRWICPIAGGGRPARRQTGVSQRGQAGFQRSRPPDSPHRTIGTTPPGSAGVPPACCPFGCRSVSLRCCSRPPCRREPHGPGRSRGRAPLPVDSGSGVKLGRFLIHGMHRMHRMGFFRMTAGLCSRTSSNPHAIIGPSCLLQQPPVLIILCIGGRCSIDTSFRFSSNDPHTGGRAPGSQANGSFPKGTGRLSEKSPAGYPPPHHRDDTPGSAGVPPACCPFGCRSVSLRCCSRPPCRREPHGPGRSRGRAPLPVDSGGGDGRSCGRICAGGTPALPGGLPPMTGSHQRDKSAEAFWRQLSLKEVHQSSCLFVFIGGSSSLTNGCFPSV